MTNKEDCLEYLKAYYGIEPYKEHVSRSSGMFYLWVQDKFGKELVQECEEELDV